MCLPSPPQRERSKGATLTDFRALQTAGAIAVTDDGKPILDDNIMREALVLGGELNFPVVQHAEDTRMTENCSMHAGARSFRLGLRGMTAAAEASIVERDVQLAMHIPNARLHVAHLSTADALKSVRRGKRAKARVTFEVTPHHFTLTDEDMRDYDSNYKMNPPLRSASDREAILVALADGTVDAIATDHAPHAAHEKEMEFERAAFGITGLETALALAITRLHREKRIPLVPHRGALHRRSSAMLRSSRTRFARPWLDRRRYDFRSEEEMDLRCREVALEIKEHAFRWMAADGESSRDDSWREDCVL